MEKVVYALWRDPRMDAASSRPRVREEIAPCVVERAALDVMPTSQYVLKPVGQ
ncbi:MAG: hypothetical protein JSR92_13045 [Proteobacteria bacterium]|nr:hypothetical protein [Pseudomonadota bacterium]